MKKKHLKLISIALITSLGTMLSCVDNDYDLNEDIDLTISVGGEEFAIPGGKTEEIKLSKILKVEEGDLVKIDATGNYYLLQTGNPSNTNIRVDGFDIASPTIPSIQPKLNFYYDKNRSTLRTPGEELTAELPKDEYNTHFSLEADLPKEIELLSHVKLNINASITFSFSKNITKSLNLKDITIKFPDNIHSTKLTDGIMRIQNQAVPEGGKAIINIPINGIDLKPENIVGGRLKIDGEIVLNGQVSVKTSDLIIAHSAVNIEIELSADVALDDIEVESVTGIVKPDININVDPITLNDLPDFLSDEEVILDVTNPMIFFTANNQTPVEASIVGTVASIYKENPKNNVSVDFTIPSILANLDQRFCLSPKNPGISGTQWIEVLNLPLLVTKIPKEIQINISAEAAPKDVTVALNHNYSIETDYRVEVPFMFGDKLKIVYNDTIDGWRGDLDDYEIKAVNATASVINKIPLNLKLTAIAITKDTKDETIKLDGVTVMVKVNGVDDGIIKAGNDTSTTPIVIEIRETIAGSIKKLDGLILTAVADSKGTSNGYLNENQTIQLINVKLKIPGGLKIDLN